MFNPKTACVAATAIACVSTANAALIYATDFEAYSNGNLSGQAAWTGTLANNWFTSGTVNTGQTAFNVMASPVAGNSGKVVRITTEKYLSGGRSKGYLDMSNTGKWATASAGGNTTLVTQLDVFVGSTQALACSFGLLTYKDSATAAGGLFISSAGRIWTASGGYALANRTDRGSVTLDSWHTLRQEWDSVTGATNSYVDDTLVATFTKIGRAHV